MPVSPVVIYRLTQRYAHLTVQKYFYSQDTLRHVSVPPTTTIRTDSSTQQQQQQQQQRHCFFSGSLSCHAHTDSIDGPFSTQLVLSHFPLRIVFLMVATETCRNVNQFLLLIPTKCTPYTKYIYLSSVTFYVFQHLLHHLQTDHCVTCSATVCSLQCCHLVYNISCSFLICSPFYNVYNDM